MSRRRINRGQARRAELREQAQERQELRSSLSNSQQIDLLNARLGDGVGAQRERARLASLIEREKEKSKNKKSKASGSTRERDKRARKRDGHRAEVRND